METPFPINIPLPAKPTRDAETHRLIGGKLCLDFTNTLNGHRGHAGHEYLLEYVDLVLWGRHAGYLTEATASALLRSAEQNPAHAESTLRKTLDLRETLFRIFSSLAAGTSPAGADLEALNAFRLEAHEHSQIVQAGDGFILAWREPLSLELPLWPVILSAADLLVSQEVHGLHECHGEGCDWLFLDTSRNHLRLWCSMEECGNRAKMRRRYARQREKADIK